MFKEYFEREIIFKHFFIKLKQKWKKYVSNKGNSLGAETALLQLVLTQSK